MKVKVITRPRQTGKTTQLIYTSSTLDCPILVTTKKEAERLLFEAKKLGLYIPDPISVYGLIEGKCQGMSNTKILVDESQEILRILLNHYGCDLVAMTVCP